MVKLFKNTTLTNAGFKVANKAAVGILKYEIIRAASTDVDLTKYTDDELKNLTSLPNELNSGEIVDRDDSKDDNSLSTISTLFNNKNYENGYTINAVGIYGKTDDGKEFLHSVTVSETPVIVPEWTTNKFDGLGLDVAIVSGDNKHMEVDLSDAGNASIGYVQKALANLDITSATTKANEYTDAQLKNYTNNENLQPKLDEKLDKKTFDDLKLSANNNMLLYNGMPLITANIPSGVRLQTSRSKNGIEYLISCDSNGNLPNILYKMFYKKSSDNDWQIIDPASPNGIVNIIMDGTQYDFKANVANAIGESESPVQKIKTADVPSSVSLIVKSGMNGIDCQASSLNNGGLNINFFTIYYKKVSDVDWQSVNSNSGVITINVDPNIDYEFRSTASNNVGESETSEINKINFNNIVNGSFSGHPTMYSNNRIDGFYARQLDRKFQYYKIFWARTYKELTDKDAEKIITSTSYLDFSMEKNYVVPTGEDKLIDWGAAVDHFASDDKQFIVGVPLNDDQSLSKLRTKVQEV